MGILSRISKVLESNLNALVDKAEDPAKMLETAIGDPFAFNILFCLIAVGFLAAVYVFLEKVIRSPFGRLLRAIREDDPRQQTLIPEDSHHRSPLSHRGGGR